MPARELPNAVHFERSLLGSILLWPEILEACGNLTRADFADPMHGRVYEAIRAAERAGLPIGRVSVLSKLDEGADAEQRNGHATLVDRLTEAADLGPRMASASLRQVREKATARRVIEICDEIASEAYTGIPANELLDHAQSRIMALASDATPKRRTGMADLLKASIRAYDARREAFVAGRVTGCPSGFRDLDGLLGGFQPGHQVVVAARPSMGKSAFMLDLLKGAATAGFPALCFSLEMPELELADRLICGDAQIDGHAYRAADLAAVDLHAISNAIARLKKLTAFEVDDTPQLRISDIRARVRKWRREVGAGKPGVIAVDYLQLVTPEGNSRGNREQAVSEISRGLKAIAKESGCTVFALAQVGRECEKRDNKRPMLSDLRESGAIEADADVVMFLYRGDYYDPECKAKDTKRGVCEVIVPKHRGGRVGAVELSFHAASTTFSDLVRTQHAGFR